jgi:hypothetical protein
MPLITAWNTPPAHVGHHLVQAVIARDRRHRFEAEIALRQRRQDAGQHAARIELRGGFARALEQFVQLLFHLVEPAPRQPARRQVALEVELRQFGRELRVLQRIEHLQREVRRTVIPVDQEDLLFGADAPNAGFDLLGLDHAFEGAHVVEDRAHEAAIFLVVAGTGDFDFGHVGFPANRVAQDSRQVVAPRWSAAPSRESKRGCPNQAGDFAQFDAQEIEARHRRPGRNCRRHSCPASRTKLPPANSRRHSCPAGRTKQPPAFLSGWPDETAAGIPVRLAGRNCRRHSCPAGRTKLPAAVSSGCGSIGPRAFNRDHRAPKARAALLPRSQSRQAPAHSIAE